MIVGGAQENTLATVRGLVNKGKRVVLVTGPPLGPEGSLMDVAERTGAPVIMVPELRREINPVLDFISLLKLYSIIRRNDCDIVHTHSSKAGILGRIAAKLAGTRVIVHTIHGLPFHPYQNRLLNMLYIWLERFAARFTDRIITVCDAMTEKAVRAGVAKESRFLTIYSGMDLEPFVSAASSREETRKQLGIRPGEKVVGKIGRFFPLKGHRYLVQASPAIVKKFPETRFLLVGDGILKDELKRQIEALGMKDRFIFTGLVKSEEMPRLISAMDVLVHASLREGLARVLPQALAVGRPAVSFDVDGAREVVVPGKSGFLVPAKNVDALADAVVEVLSSAGKFGTSVRGLVDPLFRQETMVDGIDKLYNELLEQKAS